MGCGGSCPRPCFSDLKKGIWGLWEGGRENDPAWMEGYGPVPEQVGEKVRQSPPWAEVNAGEGHSGAPARGMAAECVPGHCGPPREALLLACSRQNASSQAPPPLRLSGGRQRLRFLPRRCCSRPRSFPQLHSSRHLLLSRREVGTCVGLHGACNQPLTAPPQAPIRPASGDYLRYTCSQEKRHPSKQPWVGMRAASVGRWSVGPSSCGLALRVLA